MVPITMCQTLRLRCWWQHRKFKANLPSGREETDHDFPGHWSCSCHVQRGVILALSKSSKENVKSYLEISGSRGRTCCMEDLHSGFSRGITCQLDYLPSVLWQPIGDKNLTAIEGSSIFLSGYLLSPFPRKAGLHYQKLEAPQSA